MTSGGAREAGGTAVLMWCQPDGLWRWRWTRFGEDGAEEISLPSHQAFDSRDEAQKEAAEAYPGEPIHLISADDGRRRRGHRIRRLLCLVLVAVLVARALRNRERS